MADEKHARQEEKESEMIPEEARSNYAAFVDELPKLMKTHQHQFVVFHDNAKAGVFATLHEAMKFGNENFGNGHFIAQKVMVQEPATLSYSLML